MNTTVTNPKSLSTSILQKYNLHIGGFFDLDSHNGAGTLSAAMMAVEEINKSTKYLRDYQIILHHETSTNVGRTGILSVLDRSKPGIITIERQQKVC